MSETLERGFLMSNDPSVAAERELRAAATAVEHGDRAGRELERRGRREIGETRLVL